MKLTADQKEQLSRPRPFLFLIVLGMFALPWVILLRSGVQARQQQRQMNVEAKHFFAQFSSVERNESAQRFDRLGADLGFNPSDPGDLLFRTNSEAELAYQAVDKSLSRFLAAQTTKIAGPLAALPPELRAYLDTYAESLTAAQSHILESDLPRWNLDLERMQNPGYPFPGFVNVRDVQRLLLLSVIDNSQRGQQPEMLGALEASWRLNQAVLQRPDLVSQILTSGVSEQQAGLLRHVENVPTVWQTRLIQQAQQQSVLAGRQFDVWLQYSISQRSLDVTLYRSDANSAIGDWLASALSYGFSPVYMLQLRAIDTTQTANRALEQLHHLEACSTGQLSAERALAAETTARWNRATALEPSVVAKRWKVAGDRQLTLELTQQVLQAKQRFHQVQRWPEPLPRIASQFCHGEYWVYERGDDNTITMSLSAERRLDSLGPFRYQFPSSYR
ncbi:MAG: hypothetical protein WBC73_06800 [Phormidesmis sp.]